MVHRFLFAAAPTYAGCAVGSFVCRFFNTDKHFYLPSARHTFRRWFVPQINKEKISLVSAAAQVAACGVEMAAFGVFGL
ncbi:hypothetical protein [Parabacteroides timonensis]|uniref:hypothetical protein n=1 Tax=Parabacteroides timonensis TaxID=1871013 RepID=UPI001379617B|nr:hypothetical protein [Parabacteroides timonensis]